MDEKIYSIIGKLVVQSNLEIEKLRIDYQSAQRRIQELEDQLNALTRAGNTGK